jgi:hypothetical protein
VTMREPKGLNSNIVAISDLEQKFNFNR